MSEEISKPADATPEPTSAAPPAQTPPADATPPALKKLQELGFENVASVEEGLERLAGAYAQQREQFGTQLREAIAEVRASFTATSTEQPKASWWSPPQADLATASRYRQPDGTWKPETPADVRQKVEELERYRADFANRLLTDPAATLSPLFEEKFDQFFSQKFGQVTAQQQEQQFFEKALTENEWLFEKDPITGRQNRAKLTQEGERFNEIMAGLEVNEDGSRALSKTKAFQVAMQLRAMEKLTSAAKTPTSDQAREINERKKQEVIDRAAPPVNRSGSLPPNTKVPNRNLSPGQRFVQNAQAAGVALG